MNIPFYGIHFYWKWIQWHFCKKTQNLIWIFNWKAKSEKKVDENLCQT